MYTHSYNILYNKKAAYTTLGCKLNYAETSSLRDRLGEHGVRDAEDDENADICIVNTCSVTGEAEAKCRHAISRMHRRHPHAVIVVMGCYAQLSGAHLAEIEGVALVVGMEKKGHVVEMLADVLEKKENCAAIVEYTSECADNTSEVPENTSEVIENSSENAENTSASCEGEALKKPNGVFPFVPSCSRGERTRYFLKVQDGCNYFCTYCTIPFARGRSRNGSIASLVEQAERVAEEGGKEIVITGVNIGDFGRTTGETFLDLVRALDMVEGIERYRISSIEPNLLTDEIIDYCAGSRAFMPHFHIPLQSGSDDVLRLMHRHYDTALFRRKIERIKTVMPDAFIGVDVIVGTRGETEDFFRAGEDFIRSLDISQLHVFSYSERPGTKALEIPHIVTPQQKHERSQRLIALSEEKRRAHYARFIGTERPVLWEQARDGKPLQGWTDNYIRVSLDSVGADAALFGGAVPETMGRVRLGDFSSDGEALTATPVPLA